MEGNWERQSGAPLLLFAIPDQENQTNHYELGIPGLASYLLKHDFEGEVPGVSEVPRAEQPPVAIVFWSFRVMVGLGVLMIGFVIAGLVLRLRGTLYSNRFFLQGLRAMAVAPFVAVLAGWIVTEVGRAPWLIYGEMTHSEGVTPSLTGGMALFTLIGYVLVYAVIFVAGLYYITRVVQAGLEGEVTADVEDEADRPMRPLSAAHTAFDTETPETGK
jgi:cytochrome d ubiquinol oxidase subunit I